MSVSPESLPTEEPVETEQFELPENSSTPVAERQLTEIRDLLFGEQMRLLQAGIHSLQQDLLQRLDSLAQTMSQNFEQTRQDFNSRLEELGRHVDALNRAQENRLIADIDDVNTRMTALQKSSQESDQLLEQQLQDMATTLHEDISTRTREMMERLTQTQLELRDSKADRKTLASLLDRMASELNQDG